MMMMMMLAGSSGLAIMPWLKERWEEAAKARGTEEEYLAKIRAGRSEKAQETTLDARAATLSATQGKGPAKLQDAAPSNAKASPTLRARDIEIYPMVDGRITLDRVALDNAFEMCMADLTDPEEITKLTFKCIGGKSPEVQKMGLCACHSLTRFRSVRGINSIQDISQLSVKIIIIFEESRNSTLFLRVGLASSKFHSLEALTHGCSVGNHAC